MSILVIPDLHGKDVWKKAVEKHEGEIVFLGDYVDDYPPRTDDEIVHNLIDIISFKKENPDRVNLLLGNHDIQYIFPNQRCGGFRYSYYQRLNSLFTDNIGLFDLCYHSDGYLFSHAGITDSWMEFNYDTLSNYIIDGYMDYNILNMVFKKSHDRDIFLQIGKNRGGYNMYGGPLWADKSETEKQSEQLHGIIQVVGHTKVSDITILPHIIYTDCLDKNINFLKL